MKNTTLKGDDHRQFLCVEHIEFDDAGEFLEYLSPLKQHWGTTSKSPWIFRGQGDASWGLLPKAWRDEEFRPFRPIFDFLREHAEMEWDVYKHHNAIKNTLKHEVIDILTHTAAVHQLTYLFSKLADELGYAVPGMTTICSGREFIARHKWPDHHQYGEGPPSDAFALSQHHGLPTTLLDWTRNSWYAAFFAADSNSRLEVGESEKKPNLAVWAANLRNIDTDRQLLNALALLHCPRAENSYLHAQDALFLWYPAADKFRLRELEWPDFLKVVEAGYSDGRPKPIRKITLEGDQVSELIISLYRLRISKAHLMPTYDNIAGTLKYTSLLDYLDTIGFGVLEN